MSTGLTKIPTFAPSILLINGRPHPPIRSRLSRCLVPTKEGAWACRSCRRSPRKSVRQRCLEEQKRRRQRATKKISTFIGTFMLCFAPYVITRIVELFPAVPINPHWGIVSKCLAYSKAACDPFVYSLLRNQYKKTCADIINRLLKRSSLNASGRRIENQGNSIPSAE